jgi:bifunctional non-homologous end joining protein LigD
VTARPKRDFSLVAELASSSGVGLLRWRLEKLEGIVSKLASSPYRSGRSKTWLKTKCFVESDLILLGIDRDRQTDAPRALLAKIERDNLSMPDRPLLRSTATREGY